MEKTEIQMQIQLLESLDRNKDNSEQEQREITTIEPSYITETTLESSSSSNNFKTSNSGNNIKYRCHICLVNKNYSRKHDLKRHIIRFHGEEHVPDDFVGFVSSPSIRKTTRESSFDPSTNRFTCHFFDDHRTFATYSNVKRHIATVHGEDDMGELSSSTTKADSSSNTPIFVRYPCKICGDGRNYARKHDLKRHIISLHGEEHVPDDLKSVSSSSTDKFPCHICTDKTFTRNSDLRRHLKKVHGEKNLPQPKGNSVCLSCGIGFLRISKLREHLQEKHKMVFLTEHKEFKSLKEFEYWKSSLEDQECCSYIKQGKPRPCKPQGYLVQYWQCNRSGRCKNNVTKGTRRTKKRGTRKIGKNCTATLKCTHISKKRISVDACHTHYGHSREPQHTRLTKTIRQEIATKMSQGVTVDEILKEFRNDAGRSFNRTSLIKRSDVVYIGKRLDGTVGQSIELEDESQQEDSDEDETMKNGNEPEEEVRVQVSETNDENHTSKDNNDSTWFEKSVSLLTKSLENGQASTEQQATENTSQKHQQATENNSQKHSSTNTKSHTESFEKSISLLTGLLKRVNESRPSDKDALEILNKQLVTATNDFDRRYKLNTDLANSLRDMKEDMKISFPVIDERKTKKRNVYAFNMNTFKASELGGQLITIDLDRTPTAKKAKCDP